MISKTKKIIRPKNYTAEMGDEICKVIASTPEGLKKLCEKRPHWLYKSTISKWREEHPEFREQFKKAKQVRTQTFVDEAIKINW